MPPRMPTHESQCHGYTVMLWGHRDSRHYKKRIMLSSLGCIAQGSHGCINHGIRLVTIVLVFEHHGTEHAAGHVTVVLSCKDLMG